MVYARALFRCFQRPVMFCVAPLLQVQGIISRTRAHNAFEQQQGHIHTHKHTHAPCANTYTPTEAILHQFLGQTAPVAPLTAPTAATASSAHASAAALRRAVSGGVAGLF
eukprot:477995-Pelagomonas_calceolata.AAC.6